MTLLQSQPSRVESANQGFGLRLLLASRVSRLAAPRGVTLVELLITMLIITILAGLILGVASIAAERGRVNKTQGTITKLHRLLTEHLDEFKTRRVRLREGDGKMGVTAQIEDKLTGGNARFRGPAKAAARVYALREMMMMELPDRWSNVTLSAIGDVGNQPIYLDTTYDGNLRCYGTPGSFRYARKLNTMLRSGVSLEKIAENESAECLYLIITMATGEGEARSQFLESEIGDTDGDGANEFLDAWGHPITFLRWAPGFDSFVQSNATQFADAAAWQAAADNDHDPYDTYRVDREAFRLVPLIYSGGGDETLAIVNPVNYRPWMPRSPRLTITASAPYIQSPRLLPYAKIGNDNIYLGMADPAGGSKDNIHNHLIGPRRSD